MKKTYLGFYILTLIVSIFVIVFLATGLWRQFFSPEEVEGEIRTRIITPREAEAFSATGQYDQKAWEEHLNTKIPFYEGELVAAVLNKESEEGLAEEQFAVYRNTSDALSPMHITFLSYDENIRAYRRMWDEPIAATRAETISLFSQDLIGDRNDCIIITGVNNLNEHTMTVFRRVPGLRPNEPYMKIAELQAAGSITIQETSRSLAYQQGIVTGQSFNIASYSHDPASNNMLDQIETIYSFNVLSQQYEQVRVTRIPGSQIEQRRVRELLSGVPGVFENFINDLWYYVSPQGTIDTRQYLYFDPIGREIIFYGDEAQQVFHWQSSTTTRLGLYIRSQNSPISTLLRFIDIELESLDSIRVRVIEDVRLKITVSATWDGTYRRAGTASARQPSSQIAQAADAVFDSSWGRLIFSSTGDYTITSGGNIRSGRYVFYEVNGIDLLEMRPGDGNGSESRMLYRIENLTTTMILTRVRLGTSGIQDMSEPPITLTPVE